MHVAPSLGQDKTKVRRRFDPGRMCGNQTSPLKQNIGRIEVKTGFDKFRLNHNHQLSKDEIPEVTSSYGGPGIQVLCSG
ncbi:hypothetical protein E2P81_ATG05016 [Venturia nashicola]|nr:hypothetical protein E2P81_ATG05016 [Venturia nashicola]